MPKIKTLLVLGALLGSAAAYATQCNNGTIEGTYTYAVTHTGWVTSSVDPVFTRVPLNGVVVLKFSNGNVTTPYSLFVQDGLASTDLSGGTYSVTAISAATGTCKVVINMQSSPPPAYTLSGVTSNNGDHISTVSSSGGGYTISNEFVRVSH